MNNKITPPWLEFYGTVPHSLDYPEKSMYQLIKETANKFPRYPALDFFGNKISYSTLISQIDRTCCSLTAAGIRRGDRVTVCMPNCPQAVYLFYAVNRLGCVANMIHPLSALHEIVFFLRDSRSAAIATLDMFAAKVETAAAALDTKPLIIVSSVSDEMPRAIRPFASLFGKKPQKYSASCLEWRDFLRRGKNIVADAPASCRSDSPAVILYSGGTTGKTKGILLSDANFNSCALQTLAMSGFYELPDPRGLKMLSVMPIFHGFGLCICIHMALVKGMCCLLMPRFSIKSYAQMLLKKKPNFIVGVPTLYEALLRCKKLERADLSYLKGVYSGGDSLSSELKAKADAFLAAHGSPVPIREGYGTTECVTASCLTPPDIHKPGSIGIPFPDTFYKIVRVGKTDEVLPGEEGEICISGPSVMLGYNNNPEETSSTLRRHSDGRLWLHTGDLGTMDSDGFVYFRQRIKRMIVSSGYNVYPSQVENIIDSHPDVIISCVIGVPDTYKMQKIKAIIVLKPGTQPSDETRDSILAYCRERIAKYAMPALIEFRSELPKTLVGKIAYRVLEEEASRELTA